MDLGGLHGFNGSLLDPMKMTDAELLDNGDDDDDVMSGVLMGTNSSVLETPEKMNLENKEIPRNNGSEGGLSDVNITEVAEMMSAPPAGGGVDAEELQEKEADLQNLKDLNSALIESARELKEKVDLNEDELQDLREQFGAVEKEAEAKTAKILALESTIVDLQAKASKCGDLDEIMKNVKQLEEKIERDKLDASTLQKRNQDAIGNKNQKIATLNEELAQQKEDSAAKEEMNKELREKQDALEQSIGKLKEENLGLTESVDHFKTDLNEQKNKKVSDDVKAVDISKLQEEITKLKKEFQKEKLDLEVESKRLSDLVRKGEEAEKESKLAYDSLKKEVLEQEREMQKAQAELKAANELVESNKQAVQVETNKQAELRIQFEHEKCALKTEMQKVSSEMEKISQEKCKAVSETAVVQTQMAALEKQKNDLEATAGQSIVVLEEKKVLADKCNRLEMEAFEMTRTCNELKQMVPKLQMLEAQVKEIDNMKVGLANQNTELQSLRAETNMAKEQNSNLLQSNEKLIQTAFETRTAHKNSLENLSRECTTLKKALNDKEKQFIDSRRRIGELESNRSNEGAMAAQMIPQMQMAHSNEVMQLKQQLEKLTSELHAWQKWKVEDEKQKSMERDSLSKVLVETKHESLTYKKDLDSKIGEINSCHMKIQELTRNMQIKINENAMLKEIERGMENVKRETEQSRAEVEVLRNEAEKYKTEAEKSEGSKKELAKEAAKMVKMLQDKDALLAEKTNSLFAAETKMVDWNKMEKQLAEGHTDYLILKKDDQLQKKQIEQFKLEVDYLKNETLRLDTDLQNMNREKLENKSSVELNDVKKQQFKSASELEELRKENNRTTKRISDLENLNTKLENSNKRLDAELSDEKAKVMVLCELRDEEEELDDPPPPKRVRPPPKTEGRTPSPTKEKKQQRPKSSPAQKKKTEKDVISDDHDPKDEPHISLIQVAKEETPVTQKETTIDTKEDKLLAKKNPGKGKPTVETVAGKGKKASAKSKAKSKTEGSSSDSSQSVVEVKSGEEPEVNLVAVPKRRGRPEKDPVQEVLEFLARQEKRKGRERGVSENIPGVPEEKTTADNKSSDEELEQKETDVKKAVEVTKNAEKKPEQKVKKEIKGDVKLLENVEEKPEKKVKKEKKEEVKVSEKKEEVKVSEKKEEVKVSEKKEVREKIDSKAVGKKAQAVKRKAEESSIEQPAAKKGKTKQKVEGKVEEKLQSKQAANKKEKVVQNKSEPKAPKPIAKAPTKKSSAKKTKAAETVEVLAPRKGKGTKAAAIIAAIQESSDMENEAAEDVSKPKGKKKADLTKKSAAASKKAESTTVKKAGKKTPTPPAPKKIKKR